MALAYPPCPTPDLAQLTPFSPFSLERAQHSRVGTVACRQGHGMAHVLLWPGYNRKVAACLCTRTCTRNLGPSAQLMLTSSPTCTSGGLSHPLRLRPALPRHNPWWIWCLVFVFVSVLRFFNSSSLPSSCENNSPRLLITDLSRPITSSVWPCYYHRVVYARRFSHSPALPPIAHRHTHPDPGPSPVQPSPDPILFAGTTRLPATGYPSQISATLLCAQHSCFFQRTGRGNIDLPPGT